MPKDEARSEDTPYGRYVMSDGWFVLNPADTRHVLVGAGDGPCAILMLGARHEAVSPHYPVSDVAAKYGASAARATSEPEEAYADWPGDYEPVRLPWAF